MAVATSLAGVPVGAGVDLLPARDIALRRAARLGVVGGLTAVFVSAIGMVQSFNERELIGGLTLGRLLLLAIPFLFGYTAGKPPPALEGFAAPRVGPRNAVAGVLVGTIARCLSWPRAPVFIYNFNVRDVFINISPELVRIRAPHPHLRPRHRSRHRGDGGAEPGRGRVGRCHPSSARPVAASGTGCGVHRGGGGAPRTAGSAGAPRDPTRVNILTEPVDDFLFGSSGARSSISGRHRRGRHRVRGVRAPDPTRPHARPPEGRAAPGVAPRSCTSAASPCLLIVLAMLPPILGTFLAGVLNTAGIFLMMALGLNIVVGFSGLLDLGYVAFFAVGAYTTALLTAPNSSMELGWVFWAAVPFVLLASAIAGIMVGTPVLRMRGDYLAIVTLGFGEIARILFLSDWLEPTFGGAQGIVGIPDITIGPIDFGSEETFLYIVIVFIVVATYISYSLQSSRWGRAWMAMREDEAVAEALGVNTVAAKLLAFLTGALMAGVGGALFATKVGSVFPHSFDVIVSITVLVVIIVGGISSVPGVILGAFVLVALPELLREFEEYRFLIYGALLIFMMLRRPEGFIPSRRRAQELHEDEVLQDAWLHARAEAQEAQADTTTTEESDKGMLR